MDWRTELEGVACQFGDAISLSYGFPNGGSGGGPAVPGNGNITWIDVDIGERLDPIG